MSIKEDKLTGLEKGIVGFAFLFCGGLVVGNVLAFILWVMLLPAGGFK